MKSMKNYNNVAWCIGTVLSPSRGGGEACPLDPIIFLDFIPCSPLIKLPLPKNVYSLCSLDPENFCAVPLISRNVYQYSPYLFACVTFLLIESQQTRIKDWHFKVLNNRNEMRHLHFLNWTKVLHGFKKNKNLESAWNGVILRSPKWECILQRGSAFLLVS